MFYETLILFIYRPPVSDDVVPQAPPVSSGSDSDSHSDRSSTETETSPPPDIKYCRDSSIEMISNEVPPEVYLIPVVEKPTDESELEDQEPTTSHRHKRSQPITRKRKTAVPHVTSTKLKKSWNSKPKVAAKAIAPQERTLSYDDPDEFDIVLPDFNPSRPPGVHLGRSHDDHMEHKLR